MSTQVPIFFTGDTKDIDKAFSELQKKLKKWHDDAVKTAKVVGAIWLGKQVFDGMVAGFNAVNSVLQDSIREATEAARVNAKLEAVIKSTGGAAGLSAIEMSEYAKALMDVTDIDDDAIKNVEALLATFKEIKGSVFKEATKAVLDMASVMDGDLKGAAIQVGKALNDPMQGLTALSRVGVSFTQQQKDTIKTLQEMGDTAGAQKIILAELASEFGGAAEAAANAAGHGLGRFQLMLNNVKEDLGGKMLPVLDKFLDTLGDKLKPVLDEIVESFGGWIGNISGNEIDQFATSVTHLATTFGDLANTLAHDFIPLMEVLVGLVEKAVKMIPNAGVARDNRDWANSLSKEDFKAAREAVNAEIRNMSGWTYNFRTNTAIARGELAGRPVKTEQDVRDLAAALHERTDKVAAPYAHRGETKWVRPPAPPLHPPKTDAGLPPLPATLSGNPMVGADRLAGMWEERGREAKAAAQADFFERQAKQMKEDSRLDDQFASMQDRMKSLRDRGNAIDLRRGMDQWSFSSQIESGADVFRRIQTGAASVDPAKGTEQNTKGILAEMKKLNAKMDKNRNQKGAAIAG